MMKTALVAIALLALAGVADFRFVGRNEDGLPP